MGEHKREVRESLLFSTFFSGVSSFGECLIIEFGIGSLKLN
jgi:hypothetical protein